MTGKRLQVQPGVLHVILIIHAKTLVASPSIGSAFSFRKPSHNVTVLSPNILHTVWKWKRRLCAKMWLLITSLLHDSAALWTLTAFSVGFLRREISPSQGRYLHTDSHASKGIRNHNPNVGAGEDGPCLRPRGHSDRRSLLITIN
jgi:hypothetical protein